MSREQRILTHAESARKEEFETKTRELESQGYTKNDLTVSVMRANVMALVIMIPVIVLFTFLFINVNHRAITMDYTGVTLLLFLVIFIILVVVHEGIHGLTWACFTKDHLKGISFGFIMKSMTPYCTCKTELTRSAYITGTLMPTILLGILPSVIGIVLNNVFIFDLGLVLILSGGGDAYIVYKLVSHKIKGSECLCIDHPYECGVVTFEK